jgi:K(+)-stimulated pyrophosphate-energized sodium pump
LAAAQPFEFFQFLHYRPLEFWGLMIVLLIAFAGLAYARMLSQIVSKTDRGTKKMQDIAQAVREGADAYLAAQFKKIAWFILAITVVLYFTYTGNEHAFRIGRALAFLLGSVFSWTVGFVGMRYATDGNVRVAAAAKRSYGEALQIGYRSGTITGMLLDSLGLLGGTCIFLIFGERSYEALLGFGFGGTLLALFMRVGGGIYTKAADVGADLVGKIEKGIPEDDPRNAATIADNVGDNVGDCAGMAADIFESYEVTIVAAMILGLASFGHLGVIFPLLVRGVGVLGSIISTYTVKADAGSTSDSALGSVHRGFWIGSIISIVGILILNYFYLRFNSGYLADFPTATAGFPGWNKVGDLAGAWYASAGGVDWRPALTCMIGVLLTLALNKVTSYYTHTTHPPVQELARACQTGPATNIIQGIAVGYESTVAALAVIAVAIFLSVLCYWDTTPIFVAYGVAMTGIGMLTLTGNTISMDAFGPIADNANGIGEMGYDKEEMEREEKGSYARARQILADLDAVGNTTKAETKGIAIGSAVIAAVSLFASFIAVIAVGGEDKISAMTMVQYDLIVGKLTVANSTVFIGFLLGGAVPFLFSSMLMRAVGRAAFQIVHECREQFRDKEIWAGTKKPDYARVVDICTQAAQLELVGPAILAILAPVLVGFLLGPYALGGFLAGMILVGQLLAVFMANAGGAWDNAKKFVEDGNYGGKGSEAHKAAVVGDTVGDPLKDTAGPALNPLIKVMNMVALLVLGVVLKFNVSGVNPEVVNGALQNNPTVAWVGIVISVIAIGAIGWAVHHSKRAITIS